MKKANLILIILVSCVVTISNAQSEKQIDTSNDSLTHLVSKEEKKKNEFILGLQLAGFQFPQVRTGLQLGYRVNDKHSFLFTMNPFKVTNNLYTLDFRYQYDFLKHKKFYLGAYLGVNYTYQNWNSGMYNGPYHRIGINYGITASYKMKNNLVFKASVGHEPNVQSYILPGTVPSRFFEIDVLPTMSLGIEKRF